MSANQNSGKGQPPKSGQFRPGQTGNRKGRPKGSKNTKTILLEELDAPVIINQNGKRTRITMRRSMIKHLVHKGASGNEKAAAIVLNEARKYEEPENGGGGPPEPLGPNDEIVIAEIVRRIRLGEALPDQTGTETQQNGGNQEDDEQEDQT